MHGHIYNIPNILNQITASNGWHSTICYRLGCTASLYASFCNKSFLYRKEFSKTFMKISKKISEISENEDDFILHEFIFYTSM